MSLGNLQFSANPPDAYGLAQRQAMAQNFMQMGQNAQSIPNAGGALGSIMGSLMAKNYMKPMSTPDEQQALTTKLQNDAMGILQDPKLSDKEKKLKLMVMKNAFANVRERQGFSYETNLPYFQGIDDLYGSYSKKGQVEEKLLDVQSQMLDQIGQEGNTGDMTIDASGNLKIKTDAEKRSETDWNLKQKQAAKAQYIKGQIPKLVQDLKAFYAQQAAADKESGAKATYTDEEQDALNDFEGQVAQALSKGDISSSQYNDIINSFKLSWAGSKVDPDMLMFREFLNGGGQ